MSDPFRVPEHVPTVERRGRPPTLPTARLESILHYWLTLRTRKSLSFTFFLAFFRSEPFPIARAPPTPPLRPLLLLLLLPPHPAWFCFRCCFLAARHPPPSRLPPEKLLAARSLVWLSNIMQARPRPITARGVCNKYCSLKLDNRGPLPFSTQ